MDDPEATAALQAHGPAAHVLVVEDNLVSQRVVAAMLAKLGHVVEVANHGEEALACVRARRPDLVLMDCLMPGMDGFTATRAIREEEEAARSRVTIVAMTACAMDGDRDLCLAAGMDDYLAKPLAIDDLEAMLARWLGGPEPTAMRREETGPVSLALWHELAAELGDGELGELLAVLRRQVPEALAEMRGRLAAGDLQGLGRAAHSLCGATGDLGAYRLSRQLRALEEACRTPGAVAPNEQTLVTLERSYAEVDAFFRAQLAT